MEKFDYLILSENNEWLSTGKQETQEQLDQEIQDVKKRILEETGENINVMVFKAPSMESFSA